MLLQVQMIRISIAMAIAAMPGLPGMIAVAQATESQQLCAIARESAQVRYQRELAAFHRNEAHYNHLKERVAPLYCLTEKPRRVRSN